MQSNVIRKLAGLTERENYSVIFPNTAYPNSELRKRSNRKWLAKGSTGSKMNTDKADIQEETVKEKMEGASGYKK